LTTIHIAEKARIENRVGKKEKYREIDKFTVRYPQKKSPVLKIRKRNNEFKLLDPYNSNHLLTISMMFAIKQYEPYSHMMDSLISEFWDLLEDDIEDDLPTGSFKSLSDLPSVQSILKTFDITQLNTAYLDKRLNWID
jgi:hypothetical protein